MLFKLSNVVIKTKQTFNEHLDLRTTKHIAPCKHSQNIWTGKNQGSQIALYYYKQ